MTTKDTTDNILESNGSFPSDSCGRGQTLSYFILTVLGFSFWFFMVVPFASHRETYSWLAGVDTQTFAQQFSFGQTSTYRPLAQIATWLGFRFLDPRVFPTSILRQALLQGFVYAMFALAWWLIYSAAPQRRLFAMVACVAGGVFFSGYVQLFHIYGLFYVPVVLTLGALLAFHASGTFDKREMWFAVVATVLVFWHPFATALFVGFYFGFCLDTFRRRSRVQHVQSLVILLAGMAAIAAMVVIFPRTHMPLDTKLFGFLVSYQTNEVNRVASFVAFLLTLLVIFSMGLSPRLRSAAILFASALSVVFLLKSLPLLFLWLFAVLIKLFRLRCWSLFFLALTAALLPFGGGIGTPIYALFAIIVAVYVTPLGWSQAEQALSFFKPRYVVGALVASAIVILLVRVGIKVPIVTRVASPLLAERERTYQLENILAWLHNSDYCGYDIAFDQNAGSPIENVESAITRRNRPPAAIEDVQLFWETVLQCQENGRSNMNAGTAIVTFGEPAMANFQPVFAVKSRHAGDAVVWIPDSQGISPLPSLVSSR
ncbi:MAG: hypothetical protein WA175_12980 [Candidatus Acidiferrales bacterium]